MLPLYLMLGGLAANSTKWSQLAAEFQSFADDKYKDLIREWKAPRIEAIRTDEGFTFVLEMSEETGAIDPDGSGEISKLVKYKVDLKLLKPAAEITLAEIDFSDWSKSDLFTVVIKKDGDDEPLEREGEVFKRIVGFLKPVPLLLGHGKLYPDHTPEDIGKSWHTGFGAADGLLNFFLNSYDMTKGVLLTGEAKVKARDQKVKQYGKKNTHLLEETFVDKLIKVAEEKDNPELLENYYKTTQTLLENHLKDIKNEIKSRQEIVDELKEQKRQEVRRNRIAYGVAIGVTALFVATMVGLIIFVPPVGTIFAAVAGPIFGFIQGIAPSLVKGPLNASAGVLGFVAIGVGIKRNQKAYKEYKDKKNKQKLGLAKELAGTLEEAKLKIEQTIDFTKEIVGSMNENKEELNFSQKAIEDVGIKLIARYLQSGKLDKCENIIVPNCGITRVGIERLAPVLKDQTGVSKVNVRTLDLNENDIGKEGVEEINDVLLRNITLTNVSFDFEWDQSDNEKVVNLKREIHRQLIINKYLQGVALAEKDYEGFFDNESSIKEVARKKIYGNTRITYVPFKVCKPLIGEAQKIIDQNKKLLACSGKEVSESEEREVFSVFEERLVDLAYEGKLNSSLAERVKKSFAKDKDENSFRLGKLKLILGRSESSPEGMAADLAEFIEVYRGLNSESRAKMELEFDDKGKLKRLYLLMHNIVSESCKSEVYEKLKSLDEKIMQDLVRLSFKADGFEADDDKVFLVSSIIGNAKLIKYYSKEAMQSKKSFPSRGIISGAIDYDYLKNGVLEKERKALLKKGCYEEAKVVIDDSLQRALQLILRGKHNCLSANSQDGFDDLKKELRDGFSDLRESEVLEEVELDGEVKEYIRNIIKRNQLKDVVENYLLNDENVDKFFAVYGEMNPEFIHEFEFNSKKFREYIEFDVYDKKGKQVVCSRLMKLDSERRGALLEVYFQGEKDNKYKAALVSKMIETVLSFEGQENKFIKELRDNYLYYSFFKGHVGGGKSSYYDSYDTLRDKLEEQRKAALKASDYDVAELIDETLQFALQEVLKNKEELKEDLEDNYDLRDFDFGDGDIDEDVKGLVRSICARNKIYNIISNYKIGDERQLKDFIGVCKGLDHDTDYCDRIFIALEDGKKISSSVVLKIIQPDIGTHGGMITSGVKTFSCEKLRDLQEANPEAFVALLAAAFIDSENDVEKNAQAKAQLVANLFKNEKVKLFGANALNDPASKAVIEAVYWSMIPYNRDGSPSDNLQKLRGKLESIAKKYEAKKSDLSAALNEVLEAKALSPELRREKVEKPEVVEAKKSLEADDEDMGLEKLFEEKEVKDDVPEVAKKNTNPFDEDDDVSRKAANKSTNPFDEDDDFSRKAAKKSTNPFVEDDDVSRKAANKRTNPFEEEDKSEKPEEKFVLDGLRKIDMLNDPRKTRVSGPKNRRPPTPNRLKGPAPAEDGE